MEDRFFEQPILNSPYKYPEKHWETRPLRGFARKGQISWRRADTALRKPCSANRTTVAMAGPRRALIGQRRAAAANDPAGVAAVATALGDWRTAAGLTQIEVAAALGVALGTYSSYELGHTAILAYLVRKLAERFGVAAGQLLGLHVQGNGEGDAA